MCDVLMSLKTCFQKLSNDSIKVDLLVDMTLFKNCHQQYSKTTGECEIEIEAFGKPIHNCFNSYPSYIITDINLQKKYLISCRKGWLIWLSRLISCLQFET